MLNRDNVRFQHMLEASQAAVSHLSEKNDRLLLNGVIREQYSYLPWREMIDNQAVWLVVKESLPPLISQLDQNLQNWPHQGS